MLFEAFSFVSGGLLHLSSRGTTGGAEVLSMVLMRSGSSDLNARRGLCQSGAPGLSNGVGCRFGIHAMHKVGVLFRLSGIEQQHGCAIRCKFGLPALVSNH